MTAGLADQQVSPELIEEAILLVSELVGNSVRHARPLPDGTIGVGWQLEGPWLRVQVTDGGGLCESPQLAHPAPDDVRGRGLSIVNALAARWGVHRAAEYSTVWATIRANLPARHPGGVPAGDQWTGSLRRR